jgi:methionyl-tRNA formyltransferase
MNLVFLGTPEFAVATLDVLFHSGHTIKAVVTAPDKPAGRGLKLQYSEVKQYALDHHIPVLQPVKLKDPEFLEQLKNLEADLFIVVAFRMLPEEVFAMPPFGTFNIHASLLPQYRGAAPIHWAVINGETKTGVTSFFLNHEIDKGDIIDYKELSIADSDNTGIVYDKLMKLGAQLALETVDAIDHQKISIKSQTHFENSDLKTAPKLNKENTHINWNLPAQQVFNFIRGLSPYPGAYTHIQSISGEILVLKCFKAVILNQKSNLEPGTILTDNKTFLSICCSDYQISLLELQLQGKSKMEITPFLAGFRNANYTLKLF